jgi:Cof subfamily protein (haloacid dehalogenase superfamily)
VKLTPRLVAIDIDGTLVDSTFKVPAANLHALKRAHEAGIHIVLATGRRHTFALPIAQSLGLDVCLISSNGAVTRTAAGELFHRDLMRQETARKLLDHMTEFLGRAVITFDKDSRGALVVERTDLLSQNIQRWVEKNAPYIEEVVPLLRCLTVDPVQAMFCGEIEQMRPLEERLRDGSLDQEITVLKTQYEPRNLCILDVLKKGCSKGHALERWAAHLGVSAAETLAIGDNYNDVEMLEFAGHPFVMGNASDDLKQNGWPVTRDADDCGVAAALEQVFGA